MTVQEILFIVAVIFFVLALICIGLAVFIFFRRNIPDVHADLTGKKRAAAVEKIGTSRPGRDRRRGVARVEPTSGMLDTSASGSLTDSMETSANAAASTGGAATTDSQEPAAQSEKAAPQAESGASSAERPASQWATIDDDDDATNILLDDDSATTIISEDDSATEVLPAYEDEAPVALDESVQGEQADSARSEAVTNDVSTDEASPSTPAATLPFKVVARVVLMESDQVIRIENGN